MIGGTHQYPLQQQSHHCETSYMGVLHALMNTVELLGEELFRVKYSTSPGKVSAHDARFNTKLESTLKAFERLEEFKTCNLYKTTDVLAKILGKAKTKPVHMKSTTKINSLRKNSEIQKPYQKVFIIGAGSAEEKMSPRKSIDQTMLSASFAGEFDSMRMSFCNASYTPETKTASKKIADLKKSGIRKPTVFNTSGNLKTMKVHRNSEKKCATKKGFNKTVGRNKRNIVSFTPSKLNMSIRDFDKDMNSFTAGSTCGFSDE
ncbi:unnamed protein product [Moneuplotes crassus]|uniref:Uncharacterized protein n=1 Tax=Euplotes crassus TaxID=5936 RepID=A0AAD1UNR1_EUPCR|nr:unnamed protein product [Moneuplotes crassus]